MKKFLVVLLALAMVFAIATTAMAADKQIPDYNDTKTSTEYAVDIYRLTALGVLEGNTGWGGAYRPADNLTRAEFAKIACFMFGKQDYKDYYAAQKSAFSDVPEGHWAEGWINCANDNGLMIGVGGGKFAPEANVSKQEVATVTLRGVGYDDNLPGEWPADYIAKSQEVHTWFEDEYKDGESLFDYVQKIDGTAASRAEMAAIVNYCLDLYRVEYVGDQTMIAGISRLLGVDKDGYAYVGIEDTNEKPDQDILDVIANTLDGKTTLLWDVFNGVVYPEWQYATWGTRTPILVEAAGWGYEDFEEDELLFTQHRPYFKSRPTQVNVLTAKAPQDASDEEDASHTVSVASDYYIFDQYLDGELWQLGNRYANLTLIYNKKAVEKYEAVFAEMLSDVEYDAEQNADVYTYEGNETEQKGDVEKPYLGDVYDYDWFAHLDFAIVDDVKKGDMATVDWYSPYGEKLNTGEFCLLDDCEKHDQLYVFLKDGKLQDASCLAVDDVVYNAGPLQYNYTKGFITRPEDVHLYIVTSPAKATLEKLTYSPKLKNGEDANENPIGCYSEYRDVRQVTIDGVDYWFCETGDQGQPHYMALDGGYADDGIYEPMLYGDEEGITGLYEKLTDGDDQILFVPAYAKTYAATIIFSAASENKQYGVLVDEDYAHVGNYYIDGVEFFGPDGKNTDQLTLDENVKNGSGQKEDLPPYLEMLGTLTNYFLEDEEVVTEADDVTKQFNWLKHDAGKKDIGYIALTDKPDERVSIVTTDGKFNKTSAQAIDKATNAIIADESEKIGITALKDSTAEGKAITEDTVIFELKAKYNEDGTPKYSSVKLGDFENYKNAEFTADEFVIFAWKDKDVKVLYVVNPSFAADAQIGLFDVSQADKNKGFVEYVENGSKVYFTENQGRDLKTLDYVYAAYKTEDEKLNNVEDSGSYGDEVKTGDFVVLITENGWGINSSDAKAIIEDMLPADEVSDIIPYAQVENELKKYTTTDDTEFIDLTKGETFVIGDTDAIIHTDDAEKYGYILISDENYNLIQVVRVLVKQNNPETFEVTYSVDGEEVASETVESGKTAAKIPADPTKDDYKFVGWVYTDADDNEAAFDNTVKITEDTEVSAAWAPWLYFYPNTGAENEKPWRSTAVAEGNSPTFTDQPTNGELTFLGWASSADAEAPEFTDLSQIKSDGSPASYYAVWQEVTGD